MSPELYIATALTACLFTAYSSFELLCLELSKENEVAWVGYERPGVMAALHSGSPGLLVQRSLYSGMGLAYSALIFRVDSETTLSGKAKFALTFFRVSVFSMFFGFGLLIVASASQSLFHHS